MRKFISRLLFYPITWIFIELLEELEEEVYPKRIAEKIRKGKWLIKTQ